MILLKLNVRVVGDALKVSLSGADVYLGNESYLITLRIVTPSGELLQDLATGNALIPMLSDGYYTLQVEVYSLITNSRIGISTEQVLHNSKYTRKALRRSQLEMFSGKLATYRRAHLNLDQALFETTLGNTYGSISYLR